MLTKRPLRQRIRCRLVKPSAVASSSEKCARRSLVEPSDRQASTKLLDLRKERKISPKLFSLLVLTLKIQVLVSWVGSCGLEVTIKFKDLAKVKDRIMEQ